MPIMTELIVSVVGGVLTAIILALFTRGGKAQASAAHTSAQQPVRRGRSTFGDLIRLIIAVGGGIAVAMVGGRMLIQAGIVPGGMPTRLGLLVVATAVFWMAMTAGRR